MSDFILGQTYEEAMRRCEALIPGCDKEWSNSKTVKRKDDGKYSREEPVLVSHTSDTVFPWYCNGIVGSRRVVEDARTLDNSVSFC